VAVIAPASRPDADVDYLFLQVAVDKAEVSDSQNCGNLLAGVGPFAIEQGLVRATGDLTTVRIHMLNTESIAVAAIQTPSGRPRYDGDARIDGVPGTAAPIPIDFLDVAGSSCGALLPTGNAKDVVEGIEVTCIDNGMPVVVMRASDFGKTGYEAPEALEADTDLKAKVEAIRLTVGPMMNLGDVTKKTVPKMCLAAPAQHGGAISTRNFIPHRVHEAIGVFGAVSVATACVVPGSVAAEVSGLDGAAGERTLDVEHPTGFFSVAMDVGVEDGAVTVRRAALLRTARKLMRGEVYVPASVWAGP
jgi:4-oxalomesaconate tautomerase